MKILIIGGGGREHAIIAALSKSQKTIEALELHAAPGNGGISQLAECHAVKADDVAGIVALSQALNPDWVFVAPDDPLVLGMVDALNEAGFKTFGPRKNAAIIEGSKKFSKEFMSRHNIPTAEYRAFGDSAAAIGYIKEKRSYPAVIKCDGLALGKGVIIAQSESEAIEAIESIMVAKKFGNAGNEIVIEEYLDGVEITVLAFTDGKTIIPMPASTDHKRALDGDKGLNTGGMGVVTPLPFYTSEIAERCMNLIFQPTIDGLAAEGRTFKGCIYFGLMLTAGGDVKVIEYNCRFGDPEAQTVLPLLETDFVKIIEAIWGEKLNALEVSFSEKASACVVMASGGYPEKYETGHAIKVGEIPENVRIFHAGTKRIESGENGELVTSGGRVLSVVGIGENLIESLESAYSAVKLIEFKGAYYRTDIGKKVIGR